MTTIATPPTAPSRASPSTFSDRADAWVAWAENELPKINTISSQVNTDAATAASAETAAVAAANYKGAWSGLTGALNVPASVGHSGSVWLLDNDIADVTASEPGVSGDWTKISENNDAPFTTADETKLDYLTVTGAVDLRKPLPFRPATLTHTTGTISVDLSAADYFEFVADVYTLAQVTLVGSIEALDAGPHTLPGPPEPGDVVFVVGENAFAAPSEGGYDSDGSRSSVPTNHVWSKQMADPADTEVTMGGTAGELIIAVFRGADETTHFDASATKSFSDFEVSAPVNPPAITTVTDNAMVMFFITCEAWDGAASYTLSGYTAIKEDLNGTNFLAGYYREVPTAGTETPTDFGRSDDFWAISTHAIRPGAGPGEKDYTVNLSNIPGAGTSIAPKILLVETKTDVGAWTFNNIDQWVGGAAPAMDTIGLHAIRLWVGDGQVTAEYMGGP